MRFIKEHAFSIIATILLLTANGYTLLKVFVLPSAESTVVVAKEANNESDTNTGEIITTENSYQDDNISISIDTIRPDDTTIYVADIQLTDASYLKTALAQDTFGTNITETTSTIAENNNAIFAVNGDYYGANYTGYVIKNGTAFRDSSRESDYEDLAIMSDGSLTPFYENETSVEELLESGVVNTFAFGPTLIQDGEIQVSESDEVGRAQADNPRTAIGIIDDLHYIIIVSDGRTDESAGLSLYELAEIMQSYNVKTAYNLDGGGSSTMYFNGEVVNNPTTNGNTIKERAVSDIVYIGY